MIRRIITRTVNPPPFLMKYFLVTRIITLTVTRISDAQSRVYRTYSHAYIGRTVTRISDAQSRVYRTYSHAYSNVRLDILTAYVHVLNTYWHCKVLLCFRFLIGFFSRVDIYIQGIEKTALRGSK